MLRMSIGFNTARRYASVVWPRVRPSVCLVVCHKSVLY